MKVNIAADVREIKKYCNIIVLDRGDGYFDLSAVATATLEQGAGGGEASSPSLANRHVFSDGVLVDLSGGAGL